MWSDVLGAKSRNFNFSVFTDESKRDPTCQPYPVPAIEIYQIHHSAMKAMPQLYLRYFHLTNDKIQCHEYSWPWIWIIISHLFSPLTNVLCPTLTLSPSGILRGHQFTNTVTAWIYKKNPTIFYCKITFPSLQSLAFLNHHFYLCIYKYTDICMFLETWRFFHELIVTKSQNSPSSFLKTKQASLFSCCQPHAPCSAERRIHSIWRAKQSLFHRAGRMWGGIGFTLALWATPTWLTFREHLQLSWHCSIISIVCTS